MRTHEAPVKDGTFNVRLDRNKKSPQRLFLAIAAGVLIFALSIIQVNSILGNRRLRAQIDDSYGRQLLLEQLLSLHKDVETSQRGYTLTGNTKFLEPFETAEPQIHSTFSALRREKPEARRMTHLFALERLSAQKLAISQRVIAQRRSGDAEGARQRVATGEGTRVMDNIRREIAILKKSESDELEDLLRSSSKSNGQTLVSTVAIEIFLLLLLGAAFIAYASSYRRLAQAIVAARDSSKRQAAIFDAAGDAMLVLDDTACVQGLNPAAHKLFALKQNEAIGRRAEELFVIEDGGLADFLERRSGASETDVKSLIGKRSDGSPFEADVVLNTVKLADEVVTLLIVRDATERSRAERMKNEFVSTVSHELRTPLTSIRGALSLFDHAIGAKLGERPLQLLKIAKSNTERLTVLVDDILDIEKIGSGVFELDLQPIDIRTVVGLAEKQNQTYAADRGVRLEVTCPNKPLMVAADEGRMLQALTNLISNAAKFSPQSGTVSVVAKKMGKCARITVVDQGPGIPIAFQSQIFDRFTQAPGHESRRAGTGLGLAITKAIVDAHRGTIGYQTALGKGTRFWIDLPLAKKGNA